MTKSRYTGYRVPQDNFGAQNVFVNPKVTVSEDFSLSESNPRPTNFYFLGVIPRGKARNGISESFTASGIIERGN